MRERQNADFSALFFSDPSNRHRMFFLPTQKHASREAIGWMPAYPGMTNTALVSPRYLRRKLSSIAASRRRYRAATTACTAIIDLNPSHERIDTVATGCGRGYVSPRCLNECRVLSEKRRDSHPHDGAMSVNET